MAIALQKGSVKCKDLAQAKKAVQQGLGLGLSVDMHKRFNGDWYVVLSQEGADTLRAKHGYVKPSKRRIRWNRKSVKAKVVPLEVSADLVKRLSILMAERKNNA